MLRNIIRWIIIGLIGFTIGSMIGKTAHSNALQCGLKPVVPLGCNVGDCLCVDDNCFWVVSCDD